MPVRRPSINFRLRPALAPNVWDVLVFALVLGGLALVGVGGREAFEPLAAVRETPISLDPRVLQFKPGVLMPTALCEELLERVERAIGLARAECLGAKGRRRTAA